MNRRTFLQTSGALALSASLPTSLFAKDNFTIYSAPSLPSLSVAVATLRGELAKKYDFKIQIWRNPDQLKAGVANGEYKVMMSPTNVGVNLRNKGMSVGMINVMATGLKSIVTKNNPINELKELSGKKLIMPFKNDMPDIILKALLRELRIENVDITYTATPAEAMGMFLAKDEYDAGFLPEPMTSGCVMKGKQNGIKVLKNLNIPEIWAKAFKLEKPIIPQAGIIANVDFYNTHKEEFEILHNDLKDANEWITNNNKSAAEIGTNIFTTPAPVISAALKNEAPSLYKGSEIQAQIMKFYEIVFDFNPNLLGGKLPSKDFFLC